MVEPGKGDKPPVRTPFLKPLGDSGIQKRGMGWERGLIRFQELEGQPEKLVRVEETVKTEGIIREYTEGKKLFDQMRKRDGINIPNIQIVIGESDREGYMRVYTIVDKIHGFSLGSPDAPQTFHDKFDDCLASMIQYFWDVDQNGGKYIKDFLHGGEQFMFGRRKGEV